MLVSFIETGLTKGGFFVSRDSPVRLSFLIQDNILPRYDRVSILNNIVITDSNWFHCKGIAAIVS